MGRRCIAQPLLAPALVAPPAASWTFGRPDAGHVRAEAGGVVARMIEVFALAARASAAARYYEELQRLSDDELASRGLRRAELPRAALHFLADN